MKCDVNFLTYTEVLPNYDTSRKSSQRGFCISELVTVAFFYNTIINQSTDGNSTIFFLLNVRGKRVVCRANKYLP